MAAKYFLCARHDAGDQLVVLEGYDAHTLSSLIQWSAVGVSPNETSDDLHHRLARCVDGLRRQGFIVETLSMADTEAPHTLYSLKSSVKIVWTFEYFE